MIALVSLAALVSGCSLALDTQPFRTADASVSAADGGAADAGLTDAEMVDTGVPLVVQQVLPSQLLEGVGSGAPEVRGTAIVLQGEGLNVSEVRSDQLEVLKWRASDDAAYLAVAVRVPVDRQLDEGMTTQATLTLVHEGGQADADITIEGLDERSVRADESPPTGDNPSPYSVIVFEGGAVGGLSPARWFATSRIEMQGVLQVSGQTDGTPGAGGCAGGAGEQGGSCDARAGGAGNSAAGPAPTGGGGAGNRTPGTAGGDPGEGPVAGAPGDSISGSALSEGLRRFAGAGGGGGGGSAAGGGGGGGGAVALVSRGVMTVSDLNARGGPGQPLLTGGCERAGGGGGSGGVVVLRAWSADGTAAIDVSGGSPGGVVNCPNRGGVGGDGFVYLQTITSTANLQVVPTASGLLGPTWDRETPVIVSQSTRLSIRGVPGQTYWVQPEGQTGRSVLIVAGGIASVDIEFDAPGVRQVCLRRGEDAVDALEGRDCLAFAVLP